MSQETSLRFIFEDTDIRGDFVRLDESYREILRVHDYPERVADLLGEFLIASVLLSGTIKYKGRFVLQIRSQGKIPLLMVEATHDKKIRGIARLAEEGAGGPDISVDDDFSMLFAKGTLVVTVDPLEGEQYQSVVPLVGNSLETCLAHYFAQSEQLETTVKLAANGVNAAGFLLQQLPVQEVPDKKSRAAQWDHHLILGQTVKPDELLSLEGQVLLQRLYGEETIRLMKTEDVIFQCSCSPQRTAGALVVLDPAELEGLFDDLGTISMQCEFCQTEYDFSRETLAELVRDGGTTH